MKFPALEKKDSELVKPGGVKKQATKSAILAGTLLPAVGAGYGAVIHAGLTGMRQTPKSPIRTFIKRGALTGLGVGAATATAEYFKNKSRSEGLKKYPKSHGEIGDPGYTASYPEHSAIPTIASYFRKPVKMSVRDELDLIIFGDMENRDTALRKAGRIAKVSAIGGLAGRLSAWHPVHGGRMNRGTLIGAAAGAALQTGIEHIAGSKKGLRGAPIEVADESRKSTRNLGGKIASGGMALAGLSAHRKIQEDAVSDAMAHMQMHHTGRVSEKEAIRQNTKQKRAMGMEGETFIPQMPKFAKNAAEKAGLHGVVRSDETGGTLEDKLERLHRGAKGTPEGDAALKKLNELRGRQGKTFTGRAKKFVKGVISKMGPKPVRKIAGRLAMSMRDELDSIISFEEDRKKARHPISGTIGALTLPGIPAGIVSAGTMAAAVSGGHGVRDEDRGAMANLYRQARKAGVNVHEAHGGGPGFYWNHGEGDGLMSRVSRSQVKSATGSNAKRGIGLSKNINSGIRPGILAHEIGHAQQHKLLSNPLAHSVGKLVPQAGALYAATTSDEGRAKKSAIAGTLAAAPMMASEIDASIRGSRNLKKAGIKGMRRLTPGLGLASYAGLASLPYLTYKTKKALGGYREKETKMSARDQLDLICFGKIKRKKIRIKGRPEGDVPGDCGAGTSALSSREEMDLILFSGGYVNTEEGVKKEKGILPTINRSAAKIGGLTAGLGAGLDYAHKMGGGLVGPAIGAAAGLTGGAILDRIRASMKSKRDTGHESRIRKQDEPWLAKMSARESLNLILFADPRPRNPLGEFSGSEEGPNPNAIGQVYKNQGNSAVKDIAIGAGGGLAANAATAGIRELLAKAKKARG